MAIMGDDSRLRSGAGAVVVGGQGAHAITIAPLSIERRRVACGTVSDGRESLTIRRQRRHTTGHAVERDEGLGYDTL